MIFFLNIDQNILGVWNLFTFLFANWLIPINLRLDCAAEYKEKVRDTDDEMSMSEEDNEFKADEYKNWT